MERKRFLMICLAIIVVLSTCFIVYKTCENTVILCDYSDIEIDISECHITTDELNTAISVQLSALGLEETKLTDEIAQHYFEKDKAEQVKESIIYEIVKNRYYEALYCQIIQSSYVDEEILSEYASHTYEQLQCRATEKALSLSQYLEIDITDEEDFLNTLRNMQKEILILDAIIKKEIIAIPSDEEIMNMYELDDTLNVLETEYIKYLIDYAAVEQYLLEIHNPQIENYFITIKNTI